MMHTVIVGGGFAGVKAALELSKKQLGRITLISDEPYFLHHATLYASATGRKITESVISLEDIFAAHHDVDVVLDSMQTFDPRKRIVIGNKKRYAYDNLIIAIGVVTTYFGIKGMASHSYGIKTLGEVAAFKKHLHQEIISDNKQQQNYVIIGAGPTGIELAGALNRYMKEIAACHQLKHHKTRILLVEAAPRILPKASKTASKKVAGYLKKLGVKVMVNHKVESLNDTTVTIEGKEYPTNTAIWTSGVANHPFFAEHSQHFTLAPNGKVVVDQYLQALPCVYVIGDNAASQYSGTAATALHDAGFIAEHLVRQATMRQMPAYRPKKGLTNIPVGDGWAYIEAYGVYVDGWLGHLIRRMIVLRGYKDLLPHNQALQAWRSHYDREDDCEVCKTIKN